MFTFRRFTIADDRCAMKVGTDGVLLGAWADCSGARTIIDVGTGSGLIALMLAQRFDDARVLALEYDVQAAAQAAENVAQSPFAVRIVVEQGDYCRYNCSCVDAIVSNPPFFEETLLPPDVERANARHTLSGGLDFPALINRSAALLADGGSFQVIIPKNAQSRFNALCNTAGLTLRRATDVRTVKRKDPKRVLLHFIKGESLLPVERDEIVLMEAGQRSEAYANLCRDFYL